LRKGRRQAGKKKLICSHTREGGTEREKMVILGYIFAYRKY